MANLNRYYQLSWKNGVLWVHLQRQKNFVEIDPHVIEFIWQEAEILIQKYMIMYNKDEHLIEIIGFFNKKRVITDRFISMMVVKPNKFEHTMRKIRRKAVLSGLLN